MRTLMTVQCITRCTIFGVWNETCRVLAFDGHILQIGRCCDILTTNSDSLCLVWCMLSSDNHTVIGTTRPLKDSVGGVFRRSIISTIEAHTVEKRQVLGVGPLRNIDLIAIAWRGDFEGAGDGFDGRIKSTEFGIIAGNVVDEDTFSDVAIDAITVGVRGAPIIIGSGNIPGPISGLA